MTNQPSLVVEVCDEDPESPGPDLFGIEETNWVARMPRLTYLTYAYIFMLMSDYFSDLDSIASHIPDEPNLRRSDIEYHTDFLSDSLAAVDVIYHTDRIFRHDADCVYISGPPSIPRKPWRDRDAVETVDVPGRLYGPLHMTAIRPEFLYELTGKTEYVKNGGPELKDLYDDLHRMKILQRDAVYYLHWYMGVEKKKDDLEDVEE